MATKDWETINFLTSNNIRWSLVDKHQNRKDYYWSAVIVFSDRNLQMNGYYGYLLIQRTSKDKKVVMIKTRLEGIKKAKAYMRKH
jgi:hypothetical protein